METIKLAEKELQNILNKYPSLELTVVTNFKVGLKEKDPVKVEAEVVPQTEQSEAPLQPPVIETLTVDPINPQPSTNETVGAA